MLKRLLLVLLFVPAAFLYMAAMLLSPVSYIITGNGYKLADWLCDRLYFDKLGF